MPVSFSEWGVGNGPLGYLTPHSRGSHPTLSLNVTYSVPERSWRSRLYGGPMTETTGGGMKDFTRKRSPVTFRIDGDLFEAAAALPGETLVQFAKRFSDVGGTADTDRLDVILDALSMVLLPESAARFTKRFSDLENPIELEQASEVVVWLLERYGLRPTQPSSSFVTGPQSPESGTSSTDGQPQPELTSPSSPPPAS